MQQGKTVPNPVRIEDVKVEFENGCVEGYDNHAEVEWIEVDVDPDLVKDEALPIELTRVLPYDTKMEYASVHRIVLDAFVRSKKIFCPDIIDTIAASVVAGGGVDVTNTNAIQRELVKRGFRDIAEQLLQ